MSFFKKLKERVTKPKASMSINLSKNTFNLGEDLEGTLTVTSEEEFEANEVSLWLNVIDGIYIEKEVTERDERGVEKKVRKWVWDDTTVHHESIRLLEKKKIPAGYREDFKFLFKCTNLSLLPTYKSRDKHTIWSIGAKADIKGCPDIEVGTEVQVVKPLAPPTPPTVVKEIVKEVVMIACPYCGGLMPQTSVFCPHCGAKRKA